MIELIMPLYKRVYRLPEIIDDLNNQTEKDFRLNVWSNTGLRELNMNKAQFEYQVALSSVNIGSSARFKMLSKTEGNPIIFFDDDEKLDKDFISYHLSEYEKWGDDCILGWYSKLLDKDTYRDDLAIFLPYGTEVDFIGTGGMVIGRKAYEMIPELSNLPKEFMMAEDIYLSAKARRAGFKLVSIEKKCEIIDDVFNSNRKFFFEKQKAFERLRKEGWKLLSEI